MVGEERHDALLSRLHHPQTKSFQGSLRPVEALGPEPQQRSDKARPELERRRSVRVLELQSSFEGSLVDASSREAARHHPYRQRLREQSLVADGLGVAERRARMW
ncbi:MAG: hypothetical protein M3O76_03570, partial [Actinomycetota bacterium]|nr:hypothetical protein [Actinomycetota bacterium]